MMPGYTQADLDNIRALIAGGVLEIRFADNRLVRYQSLDAMMAAEQRIAAVVASSTADGSRRRRYPGYRDGN